MRVRNPLAFRPSPVTTFCIIVYLAVVIPLLVIHHVIPEPIPSDGGDLTEAWLDLQNLTGAFHPYNSHRNDEVRLWLLHRIQQYTGSFPSTNSTRRATGAPVTIFSDNLSNSSFSTNGKDSKPGTSVYFEGTNIIVYIRGSQDDARAWWSTGETPKGKGGVLVNAHYDSVSTGFGATDDGVGVVTILQLIKYYAKNQPFKGIVALFNNGEEDFLNGARAFSQHPISAFPHTFLNLEGAGAGGRATLFRTTDTEVTKFYEANRLPFGNVISADAFKGGVIRSETDYSFFSGSLGLRGLDVAFFEPRSRYHTEEDDTKHSSKASLNHMMTAAFATSKGLTSDRSSDFERSEDEHGTYPGGHGSEGVWFDLFGYSFAVFTLKALFAISVALLVLGPVTIISISVSLRRVDKFYLFRYSQPSRWSENSESVPLKGLHGFTRWPIAFVLATAAVIGLAFLLAIINPYILYSSPYSVWSMMISAWLVVAYVYTSIADYVRPTALHRVYSLLWISFAAWVILILATISEHRQGLASGYIFVFNYLCIYLATVLALLELFRLPRISEFADDNLGPPGSEGSHNAPAVASEEESRSQNHEEAIDETQEADESTSLLRGQNRTTFKRYSSPSHRPEEPTPEETPVEDGQKRRQPYGFEQSWSASLPSSLWILEFLLVAVFPLVIIGQVALLFTSATYQTLSDGNSPLTLYIAIGILTVLVLAPLGPFLHRFAYEVPTFLFLVFVGTLLYNIFAFPFSPANRLKLYFVQRIDLDTAMNNVSLSGVSKGSYLLNAVNSLPSVSGQTPICNVSSVRADLSECRWQGLAPNVLVNPHIDFKDWLSFNATTNPISNYTSRLNSKSMSPTFADKRSKANRYKAHFSVSGVNTRACKIVFNQPIRDFSVADGSSDSRFPRVSDEKHGSGELRLWSRTWNRTWEVDVWWDEKDGHNSLASRQRRSLDRSPQSRNLRQDDRPRFDGRVVCLWSDVNQIGVIPALDEVKRYAPSWVTVTKAADGLVEGGKAFAV